MAGIGGKASLQRLHYLDFLAGLHERLAPPTYLEIGVRHGDSLALARCPAVGIDPDFELRAELRDDVALFRETSDEYFDRDDPLAPFGGEPIAFSFIDGMHLAEFVVRDFANVERNAEWTSVVVFDDILPRSAEEAARDRRTRAWTGDVYKVLDVLARHRPDLTLPARRHRADRARRRARARPAPERAARALRRDRRRGGRARPAGDARRACWPARVRSTRSAVLASASGRSCARRASAALAPPRHPLAAPRGQARARRQRAARAARGPRVRLTKRPSRCRGVGGGGGSGTEPAR